MSAAHDSYPADLYAALHRGTEGDLAFYRAACDTARRVLELGCGHGRILEALGPGCERHGLDTHRGLLDAAAARLGKAVHLHQEDMRDFALPDTFDRILLPFSGLYCLLSPEDMLACFRRVRGHLAPGGTFVLDAYCADAFHDASAPDDVGEQDWLELGQIVTEAGAAYSVFEQSQWRPLQQFIEVKYRHVPLGSAGGKPGANPIDGTIAQRYVLRDELEVALREAGFQDVHVEGGFASQPFDADGDLWVATAS